jgi:hypothetical protein
MVSLLTAFTANVHLRKPLEVLMDLTPKDIERMARWSEQRIQAMESMLEKLLYMSYKLTNECPWIPERERREDCGELMSMYHELEDDYFKR